MTEAPFAVTVGGEYACFTRPEFKVERVSYPVITPSAARGVLEAVFWKPEVRWEVRAVQVLKPLKQTTILRNEVAGRQGDRPFFVEDQGRRQQRASLVLKDVAYVLHAALVRQRHAADPLDKYAEQCARRLARGQWHHPPYLGTREFAAWVEPAHGDEVPDGEGPLDLEVGRMLFDIAFREDPARRELSFHRHGPEGRRVAWGYAEPLFFHATVRGGVLVVPEALYRELDRLEGRDVA